MEYITLRNQVKVPLLGFGTFPLRGATLETALTTAYDAGYRLFDTAWAYENEEEIAEIFRNIKREDLFLTSKIKRTQMGGRRRYLYLDMKSAKTCYHETCNRLKTSYCDLYLLHHYFEKCSKVYRDVRRMYDKGEIRAYGVSNFGIEHLQKIYNQFGEYPMINQIEFHPFRNQTALVNFCREHDIRIQAYAPFTHGDGMKELLSNVDLQSIATKHNKTVPQIILRWIVQQGIAVIPRSTNVERIRENINIFDFALTDDEMGYVYSLNREETYGFFAKHEHCK